ncbi:branched-chain amino acid permease [Kluyvera sp. Nf5]|jgi:4-azaleucine resistance transporter AzlC|nr:branched-chain amino acid permease [Kluyvera sp. Nf5]
MLMKSDAMRKDDPTALFRGGVAACLPTIPGYWSIGFAAGAIGTLSGFTVWQTAFLATALYTGSAQFLFYSLWAAGAEMASVVLSVFLVNLRYLLMSSAMSVFFREQTTLQKIVSGLLLTDETFGVAVQRGGHQGTVPFAWMFGLNLAAWLNWILACVVGGCLASVLPPALMEGLSFSLVSMFIGLVLMIWFASRQKKLETFSVAIAVLVTLFAAGHMELSVIVIVAASLSATLATVLLHVTQKGAK